jgi:hypothetical protein
MNIEFLNFKNIDNKIIFNRSFYDNKDEDNLIANNCIL